MSYLKNLSLFIASLLTLWLVGYICFALYALQVQPKSPEQKVDAIIVLTGGQGRIEAGLDLFANGNAETLFITGVHPHVRRSEIRAMWKGAEPLPHCCIILGYEARTTQQNAEETKDWLADKGHKSIRIVTGNFHMIRAMAEFHRALSGIEIIPHAVTQPRFEINRFRFWRMVFYEYHKTLFRWFILPLENYLPQTLVNLQLNPEISD